MKKYFMVLLLVIFITPSIVFASWWNPISWFVKSTPIYTNDVIITNPKVKELTGKETSLTVKLDDVLEVFGVKIIIAELIEDSRCPIGIQCIQAGTVRVKVNGKYGVLNKSIIFSLNNPYTFMGYTGTLVSVAPEKIVGKSIDLSDFTFTFSISNSNKH